MQNKVVWITGASSGIGEALAYKFSKEKYNVIISSRNEIALEKVKEQCIFSENIKILPLDLEDLDSLNNKANEAWELFGKIDILINNGGIS